MAARLEFSRQARAELREISLHLLEVASRRIAEATIRRILRKIELLEKFPRVGRVRPELERDRRVLVVRPYVAIYRVENDASGEIVVILHIVHGARDLPSLMTED